MELSNNTDWSIRIVAIFFSLLAIYQTSLSIVIDYEVSSIDKNITEANRLIDSGWESMRTFMIEQSSLGNLKGIIATLDDITYQNMLLEDYYKRKKLLLYPICSVAHGVIIIPKEMEERWSKLNLSEIEDEISKCASKAKGVIDGFYDQRHKLEDDRTVLLSQKRGFITSSILFQIISMVVIEISVYFSIKKRKSITTSSDSKPIRLISTNS